MSVDHFCGSRILSSALREEGAGKEGVITDTAPCNSKLQLTITAISMVEDYIYK